MACGCSVPCGSPPWLFCCQTGNSKGHRGSSTRFTFSFRLHSGSGTASEARGWPMRLKHIDRSCSPHPSDSSSFLFWSRWLVFLADSLAGTAAYQKLWLDRLAPAWLTLGIEPIRDGALLLLSATTLAMLLAELRLPQRSLPRILYIVGLATMVAIALQPRSLFLFLVIWTSQHWMLASGLTSRVPRLDPPPASGRMRHLLHALNSRGWSLMLLIVLVSVILLPVFEVEANWPDGTIYYGDRIFGHLAIALRTSSFVPILLALGFSSGFVHYLLDRSVYRMSDPRVRLAASGLLTA